MRHKKIHIKTAEVVVLYSNVFFMECLTLIETYKGFFPGLAAVSCYTVVHMPGD